MGIFGFFNKSKKETLDKGLEKTKQSVFSKLTRAIAGKSKVDDEVLDDLEEILITSDVGVDTTLKIIERIETRVARDKYVSTSELNNILKEEITALLSENNTQDNDSWELPETGNPYVILVVGVNGVGKTTTIGKLAHHFQSCCRRADLHLGRARWRARCETADGFRPRIGGIRYAQFGQSQRCRRGYHRHRRPTTQ